MEDDLDRIAAGDEQRVEWLGRFYFGDGDAGLHELVSDLGAIDAREINSLEIGDGIVLRVGRYGPYLERDGQRASVPDELAPDELTVERAEELLAQPSGDRELGADPETGLPIVARTGRYGPYVTEVLPEGAKEKPRTASLFKSMSLDTISLEDALRLLDAAAHASASTRTARRSSPRNGRYGPFVQKEKETRSLESEEQLLTIDARRGARPDRPARSRGAAGEPLRAAPRSSAPIPPSGKAIVLKEGRFGPYVTDGETNASLRTRRRPGDGHARPRRSSSSPSAGAKGPAKKGGRRRKAS